MMSLVVSFALHALPDFPTNWAVHEDQFAHITGTKLSWHGTVYNDFTNTSSPYCAPAYMHQRNCSATAYVDDSGKKNTFMFFEPNQSNRGMQYFVQDNNARNDAW